MTAVNPPFSYRLLSVAVFPVWLLHACWHAIKYRNPTYLWHRLGLFQTRSTQPCIWLHAASVGEVEMLKALVEQLQKTHALLVTTFTPTGFLHAQRVFSKNIQIRALPIDLQPVSRRFIRRANIKLALIAETELWPETLYQLKAQAIPLLQINARLSEKSLKTTGWRRKILRLTLGYFDQYLTRTEQDVERLKTLGADADKIITAGNLKYANLPSASACQRLIERDYILFASTHEPEELQFASLMKQLESGYLVVIAPRHPQRAEQIMKALRPLGLNIQQRSRAPEIRPETQMYLADTLGELKSLMAYATLVVMGGSFGTVGGHNVLEPAALGRPIISGPSDDNIRQDIALLTQQDGIIQVKSIEQLAQTISQLLQHPQQREQLARNARSVMQTQSHVLENYLQAIQCYL